MKCYLELVEFFFGGGGCNGGAGGGDDNRGRGCIGA